MSAKRWRAEEIVQKLREAEVERMAKCLVIRTTCPRWLAAVVLLTSCAGAFWGGRAYESRYWSIAPPALRETWRAKEGALDERLKHATCAQRLDPTCLPAYLWEARAWLEESDDASRFAHMIEVLQRGLRNAELEEALQLLADTYRERGMKIEADTVEGCRCSVFGGTAKSNANNLLGDTTR